MKGKNNKVTVRKASLHRLFFIKPGTKGNVQDAVENLLGLQGIKEVLVSEGDYGLIVKARHSEGEDVLRTYISKNFRGRFGEVVCYYAYRK
ncbi:MAG: hypothetical protein KGH69_00020 [Candidatus Micrarchaeota archaeon]|nr:hypothetical protein [Candidatus Micrarchaeota archaeon]